MKISIDEEVLDFIIYLIKSYQENIKDCTLKDFSIKGSAQYLLGQINIPSENMYVSK